MKTSFLVLTLLVFYIHANAQYKYEINGHINDIETITKSRLKDGDNMYLRFVYSNRIDTAKVINKSFQFTGELKEPTVAMMECKTNGIKVLIDNSTYDVYYNEMQVGNKGFTYKDSLITKSKFHNLWSNFYATQSELYKDKNKVINEMAKTQNVDSLRTLKNYLIEIDKKLASGFKQVAKNNPDSYAVAYFLDDAPDFSYNNYIELFNALNEDVKKSFLGKRLFNKLDAVKNLTLNSENTIPAKAINNEIIPIKAIDTTKKVIELNKAFYKKNKYTLVDFWASWCSPCRKANIDLKAKQEAFLKKGLIIVSFSLDTDIGEWKKAIKADKLNWLQLTDLKANNSQIINFLKITQIPSNVLVNSEGAIIARDITLYDIDKLL